MLKYNFKKWKIPFNLLSKAEVFFFLLLLGILLFALEKKSAVNLFVFENGLIQSPDLPIYLLCTPIIHREYLDSWSLLYPPSIICHWWSIASGRCFAHGSGMISLSEDGLHRKVRANTISEGSQSSGWNSSVDNHTITSGVQLVSIGVQLVEWVGGVRTWGPA